MRASCQPYFEEDPEERRKEMRGRKYALWAVTIAAALVTAGLSLSCADDDNGAVTCQAACERLKECREYEGIGFYAFGGTVADCVEACEVELAGAEGGLREAFQCIPDTECEDIVSICFVPAVCPKLLDCSPEYFWYESMADCKRALGDWPVPSMFCFFRFSSCELLDEVCLD
jgi:hypothetical protein